MPDHPLIKAAKVFGWSWLGEELGIPIGDVACRAAQGIQQDWERLIQENQDLEWKLFQSASSYLHILSENQELEKKISQLQKENEQLLRRIEELESSQAAAQPQPLPEARKKARLELPPSQWLEVTPPFARCLILDPPGSGKSATGHTLLEINRWKANPYILGFPEDKAHLLPPWIGLAESFDRIPGNSIVLVDEAYLLYHARKSGFDKSVQEMSRALGLARQRGHTVLFVTHEARLLDKNIISYANMVVIKEPGVLDIKFERREIREVLIRAREFFQGIAAGERKQWSYVWSPERDFEGPLPTPLPSYWTDKISRAYAGGISSPAERLPSTSKEEKKQQAKSWREAGLSYGKIAERLGVSKATIINWVKHDVEKRPPREELII